MWKYHFASWFALFAFLATLVLTACQPIQRPAQPAPATHTHALDVAPLLGNLGDHTHPITT